MKNQDKPKMAMKSTKVVVKSSGKMPVKKVAIKTTKTVVKPKPAKVTIGRLKEVRDSLVNRAQLQMGGGESADRSAKASNKSGKKDWLGRTSEQASQSAQNLYSQGFSNYDRADRYDKIIKGVTNKKT